MKLTYPAAVCILFVALVGAATKPDKPAKTKNKLQRQISDVKREYKTQRGKSTKELIENLRRLMKERKYLRMMIGAYALGDATIGAGKYAALAYPMALPAVHTAGNMKDRFLEPLDAKYNTHQEELADTVAQLMVQHPEFLKGYKPGSKKMPKKVNIHLKSGEEFKVEVLKTDPRQKLTDKQKHIKGMGSYELANTAYHMK